MTDTTARATDAGSAEQATAETAGASPDPMVMLAKEADDARQEAAALKDRLQRALADMENLRRRTEREVADARAYGVANFARELLTVADNMRRALDALGSERGAEPAIKSFIEGVELTERELLRVLEKHGVTKLEPQGERFDPHLHDAMYEVQDPAVPSGTIMQVMQPGYRIGDRVLRPALVTVAKGGPKTPKEITANDNLDGAVETPRDSV